MDAAHGSGVFAEAVATALEGLAPKWADALTDSTQPTIRTELAEMAIRSLRRRALRAAAMGYSRDILRKAPLPSANWT